MQTSLRGRFRPARGAVYNDRHWTHSASEKVEQDLTKQVTSAYRTEQIVSTQIAELELRLGTRAGFAAWGHVTQAMHLLAQQAQVDSGERVLVCPCGHGALAVWAATRTPADKVTALDTNWVATQAAKRAASLNHCRGVQVASDLPSRTGRTYDVALMTLPKGRDLLRLLLLDAWSTLREGGRLYLAGANDEGIKSAIKDAEELCGPAQLLAYKGGNRVVCLTRGTLDLAALPEAYQAPGIRPGTWHSYVAELGEERIELRSRPGVFSWRALDEGTRLLLEVLQVRVTDRVLDVGCGSGVVGLWAARRSSKGSVTWLDVDLLACDSARASLAANDVTGEVLQGDGIAGAAEVGPFTLVVSNPPFHSGHAVSSEVAEALIEEAYGVLEPRGRLVLVASRFLPYEQAMAARFEAVETLAQNPQYRVLAAEKVYRRKERGRPTKRQRQAMDEETIYEIK